VRKSGQVAELVLAVDPRQELLNAATNATAPPFEMNRTSSQLKDAFFVSEKSQGGNTSETHPATR